MGGRVLAVRLVPEDVFARLLRSLRTQHPEAHITALAASEDIAEADETLDWRRAGRREVAAKLRGQHFDTAVLAHGADHYAARAYWRAVLLVRLSGAREVLLCEEGRLDRSYSLLAGAGRALLQLLQEICAAGFALAILAPVLVAAGLSDLTQGPASRPAGGAVDRR
jgi:hypothetical protein